jgi:uncharacterized protein YjaZ
VRGFSLLIWPTDENLPRLPSLVAHEFHHKVRLACEPWSEQTTLGDYIVLEGLAEAFAAELYGEERIGPWVTTLSVAELDQARRVIGAAHEASGDIRGYVFGDTVADRFGITPVGLPFCAGYAVGYQLVRAYLRYSGKSAVAATSIPSAQIIRESAYFAANDEAIRADSNLMRC